jgi:hypothetical protein
LACSWVTVETSSNSQCSPLFQSKVVIILCLFAAYKHILLLYSGSQRVRKHFKFWSTLLYLLQLKWIIYSFGPSLCSHAVF